MLHALDLLWLEHSLCNISILHVTLVYFWHAAILLKLLQDLRKISIAAKHLHFSCKRGDM